MLAAEFGGCSTLEADGLTKTSTPGSTQRRDYELDMG